jgi:hypothetical protein
MAQAQTVEAGADGVFSTFTCGNLKIMGREITRAAVISASGSVSSAVGVGRRIVTGLQMPTSWTAADLTFQGAEKPDGTFQSIYDSDGTEVTVSAAASRAISLTPAEMDALSAWASIKIRSGTSGSPVAQAAERTIYVVMK